MTNASDPPPEAPDLSGAIELIEGFLLDGTPHLTKGEVAERAGVRLEVAEELWRLMGFPVQTREAVAFSDADVDALRLSNDLMRLGILSAERQSALVRTWGRSFARLAEWQVELLRQVAVEGGDVSAESYAQLADEVVPRVDALQSYVWRRHLLSVGSRELTLDGTGSAHAPLAVVFVDIVGYTSRSKTMTETELVAWLEGFESEVQQLTVERDARIIKNIGDELLLVCDDAPVAVDIALELTRRGHDDEDPFPRVRAGVAYGEVVSRLGDVYGPTVNVASRLTSVARPDTVLVDEGAYAAVTGRSVHDDHGGIVGTAISEVLPHHDRREDGSRYEFSRVRRLSVKGYPRLAAWRVRPRGE